MNRYIFAFAVVISLLGIGYSWVCGALLVPDEGIIQFEVSEMQVNGALPSYDPQYTGSAWQRAGGDQLPGADPDDVLLVARHQKSLYPRDEDRVVVLTHPAPDGLYDVWVRILKPGDWPAGFLYSFTGSRPQEMTEEFRTLEQSGPNANRYMWHWLGQSQVADNQFRLALGHALSANVNSIEWTALQSIRLEKAKYKISVSEPMVVARSPVSATSWEEQRKKVVGHNYVRAATASDGSIWVSYFLLPDADVDAEVLRQGVDGYVISADGGKSWTQEAVLPFVQEYRCANHAFFCVAPDGSMVALATGGRFGEEAGTLWLPLYRSRDHGKTWQKEEVILRTDLNFKRSTPVRVFPHDQAVNTATGEIMFICAARLHDLQTTWFLCVSRDSGNTWESRGPVFWGGAYSGAGIEVLANGDLLATVCLEYSSPRLIHQALSRDGGYTWSRPVQPSGIHGLIPAGSQFGGAYQAPNPLLLGNGVLVLAHGRPGMSVSFSFDGRGNRWSHHLRVLHGYRARHTSVPMFDTSSGCGALAPVSDDSFLVAYDQYNYVAGPGDLPRNSILVRKVTVEPLN